MSTTALSATVRRAFLQDASEVCRLARRFFQLHPMARLVDFHDEAARAFVLEVLDRGTVFVLEIEQPPDRYGKAQPPKIVGGIMGMLAPACRYSNDMVAVELGWFVDDEHRGRGDMLRKRYEQWAEQSHAKASILSDVKLDEAMPNGALYERAGYEVLERAWGKRLRD